MERIRETRRGRQIASVPVIGAVLLATLLLAPPAGATELGDDVVYPLVFPVDGPHEFRDTFWAARTAGIHHAQDIMADKHTPVVAAADGTVKYVNGTSKAVRDQNRCCTLILEHDDGWQSWYIHLDNDTPGTDDGAGWGIADGIGPGVRVAAGQLIGWLGDSGNAEETPPHLHFELHDGNGVIVNPYQALVVAGGNGTGSGVGGLLLAVPGLVRPGDRGNAVMFLQAALNEVGFDAGIVDGRFGPRTLAALTAFQQRYRLEADGLAGVETKAAVAGLLNTIEGVLGLGARGDLVQMTQRSLAGAGFDPGPVDGIFGVMTLRAVIAFQREGSLSVDGLVGPSTKAALGIR